MAPSLNDGQLVIATPRRPRQGNVVVVKHQGLEKIKRVTAINGDSLFIEGDNPEASRDSRHFGLVPAASVLAVVTFPRVGRRRPESTF